MANKSYEKYRWFFTSSGKLVVGGKSSLQNEEVVGMASNNDVVMHTATPGSPFCVIKNPSTKDSKECATFTACFSQEWKKKKKNAEVHIFRRSQMNKKRGMKQGTFGISGNILKKKVDLKLALDIQSRKLRAVPITATKKKLAILTPGNMDKEQATIKIMKIMRTEHGYPVSKEEVMSAIPSGNLEVKER